MYKKTKYKNDWRQWSVNFSIGDSEQDFEFHEKFQGRGNRDLKLEKESSESQMCTEGMQTEPFQRVKAQRDKRRRKVEGEQG